ncbi:hypothetical protein, partial [Bifidobacterium pseudocatenulatum]|uniref:hypothetical protein n=1 Tax=Bifidobacterium pseudocatenulatum TaxID=28026 RepID=UPI0022E53D3D
MSLIEQAYDWLPSRMMMVLSVVTSFHTQTQKTMNIAAAATASSPISRFSAMSVQSGFHFIFS